MNNLPTTCKWYVKCEQVLIIPKATNFEGEWGLGHNWSFLLQQCKVQTNQGSWFWSTNWLGRQHVGNSHLSFFSSILLFTFQACILFYSTIPIPLMSTIDRCSLQCSHCVFCSYVNSSCVGYCLMFNVHYSHCLLVFTMYDYL
jgi:hypothetical protein